MKAGPERELAARYLDRFGKSGQFVGLEAGGVVEIAESRARTSEGRKREEARKLSETVGSSSLVLLDERGKNLTSMELARHLSALRDTGARQVVIAIGGPDGHDANVRKRADLCVSFGAQTWPHQLVRVMLAEQLYRAVTILSGHPYHRD